jgi:hypothetical protein
MRRDRRSRLRAAIWGLTVAACFVAVAATAVAAQRTSTTPNPEPLWNAYPLDDTGGSSAAKGGSGGAPASATTTTRAQTATTHLSDEAGDGPPWLLMALAAAGGALFVVALVTLQGRRARRREPELAAAAADKWPWLKPSDPRAHERRVQRVREATNGAPPPEPAFEIAEAIAVPRGRFEREVVERNGEAPVPARNGEAADPSRNGEAASAIPNGRVTVDAPNGHAAGLAPNGKPARRGPICQVRWSPVGACFYAVMTDADGFDERVARSPSFEWRGHEPPDEDSREARAALRVLSKELRDTGWRAMRVKGTDFDEQRWYARRFRGPVAEDEEVSSPRSGSTRA